MPLPEHDRVTCSRQYGTQDRKSCVILLSLSSADTVCASVLELVPPLPFHFPLNYFQVDVWALGCLLYTLAFQRHPFDSESPLQILNCKWDFPARSSYSPELHGLIISCLEPDPKKRPTVFEITERAAVTYGEKMSVELTGAEVRT